MEEIRWRENWHVAASSNHFQLLQVATSLHLGSWFPKKEELEKVAQLMKTDPKDLRNLYKNSHWRELRLLILEKRSCRLNECTSEKFNGRELWKVFEGIIADWSSATFKLKDLTAESRVFLLRYWTSLLFAFSTSSQQRRPGTGSGVLRKRCLSALQDIGREEHPP